MCSNIPQSPAYGVYISQLIRYARACSVYEDFLARGRVLTLKLLKQGYLSHKHGKSLKIFYGRYTELLDKYNKSVSDILADLFDRT